MKSIALFSALIAMLLASSGAFAATHPAEKVKSTGSVKSVASGTKSTDQKADKKADSKATADSKYASYAGQNCRDNGDEKFCMVCNIYFEARGEPPYGKVAV